MCFRIRRGRLELPPAFDCILGFFGCRPRSVMFCLRAVPEYDSMRSDRNCAPPLDCILGMLASSPRVYCPYECPASSMIGTAPPFGLLAAAVIYKVCVLRDIFFMNKKYHLKKANFCYMHFVVVSWHIMVDTNGASPSRRSSPFWMEWRWDDNDGVWCVVGGKGVTDTKSVTDLLTSLHKKY